MSLTVSPIISLKKGARDHVRVVSSTKEERVVVLLQVGRLPALEIHLDLAARALRAALPAPGPALMKTRHPITCLDARPTTAAQLLTEERRAYALRISLVVAFALSTLLAVVVGALR